MEGEKKYNNKKKNVVDPMKPKKKNGTATIVLWDEWNAAEN